MANALSIIHINNTHTNLNHEALAATQEEDSETKACRISITNLSRADIPYNSDSHIILCIV